MSSNMKSVVFEKYGSPDVLELQEVEKPAPAGESSFDQGSRGSRKSA